MKRLVYSPSIKAWIKTDSGIVDLSPYIIKCDVYRVIDNISTAELEFRNPKVLKDNKPRFLFTEREADGKVLPVFHPMDPITIILERIAGKPIQVFTGYCDTTPDVQLFPGTAKIKASCTLKRLNYTYFDPGLSFVNDFMKAYGWNLDKSNGKAGTADTDNQKINKVNRLNDSSIGNLLYGVLNEIGGWNNDNIYIQSLPRNIEKVVGNLFDEFKKDNSNINEEVAKFVREIIGRGDYGKFSTSTTTSGGGGGAAQPSTGGSGWKTTEASWFDDPPPGASGKLGNAPGGLYNYAELGTATSNGLATNQGYMAALFGRSGELPMFTKVEIRYKGKSIIASKTDRGYGSGSPNRAIDLWRDAADALNFTQDGTGNVEIRLVD